MNKSKSKILLIADDAALCDGLCRELLKEDYLFSRPQENVMQSVFDEVPHLIIIDEDFDDGEGRSIASSIKEDAVLQYIPILLLVNSDQSRKKNDVVDFCVKKNRSVEKLIPFIRQTLTKNYNELDLNPLTHLPGTRSSVLRIENAIQSKQLFAVSCVDLSNMTAFNSAYGVARGDEIIRRLASIIKEVLRKSGGEDDFLGHLGGDDLIILTRSEQAVQISEAVIHDFDGAIQDYYDPHDRHLGYIVQRNKEGQLTHYPIMGVSIAIVQNDHMPLSEMSQISQIAGQLKRYMKGLPGSCYIKYRRAYKQLEGKNSAAVEVHFPSKMTSIRVSTASPDSEKYSHFFNTCISEKKIQTFYQPIVDMQTKKVVGYEALTRGAPGNPFDDAAMLFSVARESGRVKELDKLCVDFALRSGQAMGPDMKLFLNLNHETLIDSKVMQTLFSEKGVIGFKNIVIEVTEQSLLRSFDRVREALLELKEQGVSVAIDDVGGGAVSLRDVAILKPDYMKFDRSLIRQIDASATKQQIVVSMKVFANGIQAMTTAEGIETKQEYEAVLACGINLGQGYYFARPGKPFPVVAI